MIIDKIRSFSNFLFKKKFFLGDFIQITKYFLAIGHGIIKLLHEKMSACNYVEL